MAWYAKFDGVDGTVEDVEAGTQLASVTDLVIDPFNSDAGFDSFDFKAETTLPSGDGDSDGADFLIWQRNFGTAGSETVSEPSYASSPEINFDHSVDILMNIGYSDFT